MYVRVQFNLQLALATPSQKLYSYIATCFLLCVFLQHITPVNVPTTVSKTTSGRVTAGAITRSLLRWELPGIAAAEEIYSQVYVSHSLPIVFFLLSFIIFHTDT